MDHKEQHHEHHRHEREEHKKQRKMHEHEEERSLGPTLSTFWLVTGGVVLLAGIVGLWLLIF